MFDLKKFLEWLDKTSKGMPHTSRYHQESFSEHTIAVAYNVVLTYPTRRLYLAALLHDIGKPETLAIRNIQGSTFYDHETHLDLVKEFLSEDDEDYDDVCDLIRCHMLPYKMKGPDPWKTIADEKFLGLIRSHDISFVRDLLTLHLCDIKGSFSNAEKVPDNATFEKMLRNVICPSLNLEE